MIQKEISIEIARPIHEVFAFVGDASKAPTWLGLCVSLKQASPGPMQVGTQLHYTYRLSGQKGETEGEVTAYELDRHFAMKFRDKMFEVSLDFSFSATSSGGTLLKHVVEIQPQGFAAKLMSGTIASATEKQLKQDMERLKALLESSSR